MDPVPITLDPMTEGDSWDGIPVIGPITFGHYDTATPPVWHDDSLPGILTKLILSFRRDGTKDVALHCESGSGAVIYHPIIIDHDGSNNPPTWEAHIAPMGFLAFPLTAGRWVGDLEAIYDDTNKKTLYRVTQVVTTNGAD